MHNKNLWKLILGSLFLTATAVWLLVFNSPRSASENFRIIACDVGQGDATLATYGDIQILTDGGPGSKVLDCLEKYMSVTDRKIELVVITHADKDHFGGLIDVFEKYQVENVLVDPFDKSTQDYQALEKVVGGSGAHVMYPIDGTTIRYSEIYLDILWPKDLNKNFPDIFSDENKKLGVLPEVSDTNSTSIVIVLRFQDFDALLTGDIGPEVSDSIAEIIKQKYPETKFEYFKVPHHGSKNGMSQTLFDAVNPEVAIISVGKNSYGHPHKEILDMLTGSMAKTLRTDELGDIVINVSNDGWKYVGN